MGVCAGLVWPGWATMDLSRISAEPRLRSGWDAIDLGFVMARCWYRQLFLVWAIPVAVCYLLLTLLPFETAFIPFLITWWLKPLWDRLPLMMGSRLLFGEPVGVWQTLKQGRSFIFKDWFAWLTWRRFSPSRSFDMPVTLLEGLKGEQRASRLGVLHIRAYNNATWLTIVGWHVESILLSGMLFFLYLLLPEGIQFEWWDWSADQIPGWLDALFYGLGCLSMMLFAPFYTMAGFSLYISRRMELEAWDIEIRFRHLLERQTRGKGIAAGLAALVLAPALLIGSPEALAIEEGEPLHAQSSKTLIKEVLAGEDFHKMVEDKGWRLKGREDNVEGVEPLPDWFIYLVELYESLQDSLGFLADINLAQLLEILMWCFFLGLVGYLIYRYRSAIAGLLDIDSSADQVEEEVAQVLFGLDVRSESLPDDVPGEVLALWEQGKHREALGLLYRSSLSRLIHDHAMRFYDGHTEEECLVIVKRQAAPTLADYMQQLTRHWQRLAYAHREPEGDDVKALCEQWPGVFSHVG